jgi:Tol biopolymer transport system component
VGTCAAKVRDRRLVLLVDGLDSALDGDPEGARSWLRALLRAPVQIVLAAPDLALVEGLRPESAAPPSDLLLGPLDNEAAEALLKASLGEELQIDPWATRRALEVTSHHPLYLRRIGEALQECCTIKSILMQPDVEAAIELLLDRSLPEFSVAWQELSAPEQFVLSSLGALRGTRGAATQYDVRSVCDQYGYELSWGEILAALDRLAGREILEKLGSNNYRFSLELLRLWVRRHRPPEHVLQDGGRSAGRPMAAYQVSKVKRALGRRPALLMSVGSVLLVVVIVVLQPVFWRERGQADRARTPRPIATLSASTLSSTRPVAPTDMRPVLAQPTLVLPGYDLVVMSRSSDEAPWQLLALDPLTGKALALTQTGSNERTPRWSPDGTRLAFVSDRDGEREVYVYDLAQPQTEPVNLSQHPAPDWQPAWSPDGQRVAFASHRDGNWEIYVVDADGANLERLTAHPANDFAPSWAPDGRRLVFASRRYTDADLFAIDVETRALTQLTAGQWNEFEPAWSPDGQWIAYVTHIEDQGDIFVMRADGSEAVNLTHSPYANDFQPAWTPDSERLIYVSYTTAKGDYDLWSMRRDGGDARVLVEAARDDLAPNWRLAGRAGP